MMEKRAVQISYQLWMEWITHGYISTMVYCVEGIPEGAQIVGMFYKNYQVVAEGGIPVDLVFVIEGENWATPTGEHTIDAPWGETFPLFTPVLQVAECSTCEYKRVRFKEPFGVEGWYCLRSGCGIFTGSKCSHYKPRESRSDE